MTIAASPSGPTGVSVWGLIFADDFNFGALDTTKWFPGAVYDGSSPNTEGFGATGTPPIPGSQFALYTPNNVAVSGTVCTLTCKAQVITGDPTVGGTGTNYNYTSGCISTQPNTPNSGTPGFVFYPETRTVIEAVIKVPAAGVGLWPAWWTSSAGTWTYEVDVFEFYNSSTQPQQNMHFCTGGSPTCNAQSGPHVPTLPDLSTAFHTYTADINSNGTGQVDFYIDGVHIVSYTEPGYQTAEMLLILNVALNSASPTNLPASMEIDSVAVYQPELSVTSVVVAPLDTNNKILPAARDNVSSVFTTAQSAASLQNGLLHRFDATSASVAQTLPTTPSNGTTMGFKRMDAVAANTVTLTAGGSDVIEPSPYTVGTATIGIGRTVWYVYNSGVWSSMVGHISTTGVNVISDVRYRTAYGPNAVLIDVNDSTYGADPTGATSSTAAIVAAAAAASAAWTNGAPVAYLQFQPGSYQLAGGAVTFPTAQIGLLGPDGTGCKILGSGTGPLFTRNQTANWNTSTFFTAGGAMVQGITFDGTACTGIASGLKDIDVSILRMNNCTFQNFTGAIGTTTARTAGYWQYLDEFWSERSMVTGLNFLNNTVGHLQDGGTSTGGPYGPASFDYSQWYGISFTTHPGQIGRLIRGTAACNGGSYHCIVNASLASSGAPSYVWAIGDIGLTDATGVTNCLISVTGETDGSGSVAYDFNIAAAASMYVHGVISLSAGGGTNFTAPSGNVYANGLVSGECSSPTFFRPLQTIVGISGASTGKTGLWTCNQSTRYGLQIGAAQGTAPTVGVTYYNGTGAPTFSATAGDRYHRLDTSTTANQREYICTGSTSWTALSF
jgi:hypothetical protein